MVFVNKIWTWTNDATAVAVVAPTGGSSNRTYRQGRGYVSRSVIRSVMRRR